MSQEKKIFLDRTDALQVAVGKVIETKSDRVVLNIPRQSVLGASVHNFQILKRESETAGKELAIESIDEHILELAGVAKIPAKNPIFRTKERTVTDIIPKMKAAPIYEEKMAALEEEEETPPAAPIAIAEKDEEKKEAAEEEDAAGKMAMRRRRTRQFVIALASFAVIFGAGYALAAFVLPRAMITLTIQKTSFAFNDAVTVSSQTTSPKVSGGVVALPGELQTAKNSVVMAFPATGSANVSTRSGGVLTVYNAYSSAAQTLVAQTRFESPDGKIFKSTKTTVVPGAKIASGTIVPSSVQVAVLAEAPGPDWNVGPSSHWTIPGFQGTPRYDKFYADAQSAMTGGASGTIAIATQGDVASAKASATVVLQNSLTSQIGLLGADKFKILPGASSFTITDATTTAVNSDGQFSILVSGTMQEMAFDEAMLKDALLTSAGAATSAVTIDGLQLNYGTTTLALSQGSMTFKLTGDLVYEPTVDVASVKQEIAGKDEASLKSIVFGITGLEKANISFWPFWVNAVPADQSKIELNLN